MIHIVGKGNGEAEVFEDESPPLLNEATPRDPGMAVADTLDALVDDDGLRPAGSNAAPPLTVEQAQG